MTRLFLAMVVLALLACTATTVAAYQVDYDFDTAWTGDYAPGWENTDYRHGDAPKGRMMEQISGGRNSSHALRLLADSTPVDSMFWAAVNPTDLSATALAKQYDPWVSVWYYDVGWENGDLHQVGQLFTVPSWVNEYCGPNKDEDWTDVQFGARANGTVPKDYYYVAAGENSPGWVDTLMPRAAGAQWVNLKMQLSSVDGKIHFYMRTSESTPFVEVGQSYRNDYVDLGAETGLMIQFTTPLSQWVDNKPSVYYDDFAVGSNYVPEPMSIILGIMGLSSVAGFRKLRRK